MLAQWSGNWFKWVRTGQMFCKMGKLVRNLEYINTGWFVVVILARQLMCGRQRAHKSFKWKGCEVLGLHYCWELSMILVLWKALYYACTRSISSFLSNAMQELTIELNILYLSQMDSSTPPLKLSNWFSWRIILDSFTWEVPLWMASKVCHKSTIYIRKNSEVDREEYKTFNTLPQFSCSIICLSFHSVIALVVFLYLVITCI